MKAYIAGPIRGVPDYVQRFHNAAATLLQLGATPINPIETETPMTQEEIHKQVADARESGITPSWILRDLALILGLNPKKDCLVYLPGSENSEGALAEIGLAKWLGLPVYEYESLINPQAAPKRVGDPRFHALLKQIGELHDKKQQDYGSTSDPFANVRGSKEWGVSPWIGALVRLNDKVHRLQQFARKGALANESAEDSMMDIAVYALIALVLYREESA